MIARSRTFATALLLLSLGSGVVACGSARSDPGVKRIGAAISGGEPDSADSNVFLLVSHRAAEGAALCSASLIAPNLLLTARHCVADVTSEQVTCGLTEAGDPFPANTFFATNALTLDKVTSTFSVSAVNVPTQGSDICGFDIALVTLEGLVPPSVATPLIPRIDRDVTAGELYSAVGYGQTSPGDAGVVGERRGRAGLKVSCAPGVCGKGVEASEFVGDAGICSGDSGGPALDADGKVVGVVSRSATDCDHPVYGSVASWKDWITGVARQAATDGKYAPPFWVGSGTSDAPPASNDGRTDAGDGAAGSPALPGAQGDKCDAPSECQVGYECYSPTGTPKGAYCAAECADQSQCSSSTGCDARLKVCIAHVSSSDGSSSCALSSGGLLGGSAHGVALAGLALALAGLKRRRLAHRK
jgi:hypothetical protein